MLKPRLLYVTDALCGWCFATGSSLESALAPHADSLSLSVISYGLCAGEESFVVREGQQDELRKEIDRIVKRSGASFGDAFIERFTTAGARFDSQPAAEALVAVRELMPDAALRYLHSVQHAIYVEGADPADREQLRTLAVDAGVDAAAYDEQIADSKIAEVARADYARAAELGVKLVPTLLLLQDCGAPTKVFSGYIEADELGTRLKALVEQSGGEFSADGPACGIDGCCE